VHLTEVLHCRCQWDTYVCLFYRGVAVFVHPQSRLHQQVPSLLDLRGWLLMVCDIMHVTAESDRHTMQGGAVVTCVIWTDVLRSAGTCTCMHPDSIAISILFQRPAAWIMSMDQWIYERLCIPLVCMFICMHGICVEFRGQRGWSRQLNGCAVHSASSSVQMHCSGHDHEQMTYACMPSVLNAAVSCTDHVDWSRNACKAVQSFVCMYCSGNE